MAKKRKLKDEIFDWILSSLEYATPPENKTMVYDGWHGAEDGLDLTYDMNGTPKKFHVKIEISED
jgi:hypothetical protein